MAFAMEEDRLQELAVHVKSMINSRKVAASLKKDPAVFYL